MTLDRISAITMSRVFYPHFNGIDGLAIVKPRETWKKIKREFREICPFFLEQILVKQIGGKFLYEVIKREETREDKWFRTWKSSGEVTRTENAATGRR